VSDQLKKVVAVALGVLVVVAAFIAWQRYQANAGGDADAEKPSARTSGDTIRFAQDAPQLAFLQIQPVGNYPEPMVDSLNARLAYDDNRTARVYSPIGGRVLKITADVGRNVKAGDELLALDAPDYAQATSDEVKAQADLQRKREANDRAQALLKVNGISLKDAESAEADFRQAEAEAQRAAARLHNLQSMASVTDGKFVLRAPISGTISERQVNLGSEVRTDAASPLFVITEPKKLWALIDLPEIYLDKVRVGQPVSIEVDAYPGEIFKGKVTVIAEALDPVTRRIQVRAEVDNSSNRLRPEMFARATPVADNRHNMPRIPNTALFAQGIHSYVFVEQAPGVLQRRRIELGLQSHDYSYVKEGLQAGDRVVTTGALLLNSELAGND
jgi:cobalt-zinc-cadmium efflux system membrane fusion protein